MSFARTPRWILAGLALVGLLAGALPAQAATAGWADPAGDATMTGAEPAPSPFASNPAFDITKVTISSDGGALAYRVLVPGLVKGDPHAAYGYFFRMYFTVEGKEFHFRVGESPTGPVFSLRDPAGAATECKDCKGTIDRESKQVVVTAPLAAISAAFKKAELGDSAAGKTIDAAEVWAQRYVAGNLTLMADDAIAPKDFSLTI